MLNHGILSSEDLLAIGTRPPPLEMLLPYVSNQTIPIEIPLAATIPTTSVLRRGSPYNPMNIPQVDREVSSLHGYVTEQAIRDPTTGFDSFL